MIREFRGEFSFLSNFHSDMRPIELEGVTYPTVEHAYQATKTLNRTHRMKIARAASPAIAKRMGGKNGHDGFKIELRPDWDRVKIETMAKCLARKFEQPALKAKLLATGDLYLMEGNWYGDEFWGWSFKTNAGLNMLGRCLMALRNHLFALEELKEECIENVKC